MEHVSSTSHKEVSQGSGVFEASCFKTIKRFIQKAGFSKEIVEAAFSDLRRSTAYLYQEKWSRFLHFCDGRNIAPHKVIFQQLAEFFLYLQKELKLTVSAIKFCRSVLYHDFICLAWILLQTELPTGYSVVSRNTTNLGNLSQVLKSLICLPYEPLNLSIDKLLTWKTCFLLALVSPKLVSKLHCLFYQNLSLEGMEVLYLLFCSRLFGQNPESSVYDSHFEEFTVLSLVRFVGNIDRMLLCPVRALKRYLSRTEQFTPECFSLFVFMTKKKKWVA